MKRKKFLLPLICIFFMQNMFSQNIEKLGTTNKINYIAGQAGAEDNPHGIYVDEINQTFTWYQDEFCTSSLNNINDNMEIQAESAKNSPGSIYIKLNDDFWSIESLCVYPVINRIPQHKGVMFQNGISFILKKDSGYIIYYVDKEGIPGAVDTTGKIYSNTEAIKYLQEYDKDKFEESRQRAKDLDLLDQFDSAAVLVWGQKYYSTVEKLNTYLGSAAFLDYTGLVQYDQQGNCYQLKNELKFNGKFSYGEGKVICINSQNQVVFETTFSKDESETLYLWNDYSSSWLVGYGGNIYFYIAGASYTEVFRIRRTWGDPDFYAMAVNGWTDDDYGRYADEVLSRLSKADLRLLRNTVYALYGYHFNSRDLASRFDKEVWYTDKGLTLDHIQLPEHRQRLVEKIQELEAGK